MKSVLSAFVRFWTAPVPTGPMAAFRLAVGGLIALDTALTLLPHAREFFGPTGLFPTELHRAHLESPGTWSLIPPDASAREIRLALVALLASAAGLAAGIGTRFCSVATWALLISVHQRNPFVFNGGDFLLQAGALYLMLMPSGATGSVDAWIRRRRGRPPRPRAAPWGFRLAQIQLAVMYFFTGASKLPVIGGPGMGQWISGHAVAAALGTPTIARFEALASLPWWVSAPLSWGTVAWELAFPLLISSGRTRLPTLACGVLLHLAIFATLEVNAFSFAALAYYVLFLPPAWFERRSEGPPLDRKEGAR